MNRKIIATSIVALMPACVAGDPESLICIDWEADGIDQCADSDGVDAPPPEEPEPPAVACDLIGDALGFDLVEVHPLPVSAGVWMGLSSAELVFSPDIVGFFWHWLPGGDPGDPAVLDSLESDLVIYTTTPDLGQALLGYAYVEPGTGGSATLVREDPQLGPPVEVAAFSVPLGTEAQLFYAYVPGDGGDVPHRWTFSGGLRSRGVVTPGNSTLAGPSGGNVMITEEGMPSRGFLPTMGWCAPAPTPADDDGTGNMCDLFPEECEPDPEPEPDPTQPDDPPGTFDPCVELGYGPTTVYPAGYSPTWVGEHAAQLSTLWISQVLNWHWGSSELMEGAPAILSTWGTVLVEGAPDGAVAAFVLMENIVEPFTTPALTRTTATSVEETEAVQLGDNSWLVWVDSPVQGPATWGKGDTFPQIRGWARDGLPGVPATGGNPGVRETVGGNGWAFMPAAGYCASGASTADESGGG